MQVGDEPIGGTGKFCLNDLRVVIFALEGGIIHVQGYGQLGPRSLEVADGVEQQQAQLII